MYEAHDRLRGERTALKQLRATDVAALRRFKNEFRALSRVRHPNLIRLGELISHDRSWLFTMELVEETDLLRYVRPAHEASGRGFDEERIRSAFRQLADGVAALHAHGMIHRDLKPPNVLVDHPDRVVVLDFGLVATLGPGNVAQSTTPAGTPAYMSPEQVDGRLVTPASDWYSVGVMLYEALTGQVPFAGTFHQMLVSKIESTPPLPRHVAAEAPEDLARLCTALLRPNPDERPRGDQILDTLRGGPRRPTRGLRVAEPRPHDSDFVGRREQLADMQKALTHVRSGGSATVFVKGLSGMGKTSLVRHFLAPLAADDNVFLLEGRCYERETVPYKAVDSLLDELSRRLDEMEPVRAARYVPRDWPALTRLFPVLEEVGVGFRHRRAGLDVPDAAELRRRGFAALRELLGRIAEEFVLVLFIDDLQWGDLDSGHLLKEVLRVPDPIPLLFIASYRSDEITRSPLLRMLEERREPTVHRCDVAVGELAADEALELALRRLGSDAPRARERAAVVARESRGSPFFVDELARHVGPIERVPGDLQLEAVLEARLAGLSQEAGRLLRAIAVSGRPIRLDIANTASGLDPRDTDAIDALEGGRWVRRRAGQEQELFEVFHDRIRDTVVGLTPADRLPACHHSLALALEASGVADAETLAEHYAGAGEPDLAARHALRAAQQAAEALGFDRAARLYRMSFELGHPEGEAARDLLRSLGDALVNAGRGSGAAEAYLRAASFSSAEEAMELDRAAAEQYLISGRVDDGLAVLDRVLGNVGMKLAPTPRQAFFDLLLRRLRLRMRGLSFVRRAESDVPRQVLQKIDVCWSAAVGLAMVDVMRSIPYQARGLWLSLRAGEPYRVTRSLIMETGFSAVRGGRTRRRTRSLQEKCRALVREVGRPHTDGLFAMMEGVVANLEGRFDDSLRHLDRADRVLRGRCTGVPWELDNIHVYSLVSLFHLGQWKEVRRRVETVLEEARQRDDHFLRTHIEARQQFLLKLLDDDPGGAAESQEASLLGWSRRGFQVQHYWDWYARGEIDLYAGRAEEAHRRLEERWREYRTSFLPYTQAIQTEILCLRARVRLALAGAREENRPGHLHRVARDVRSLDAHGTNWAAALADLLRTLRATFYRDRVALPDRLRETELRLRGAGLRQYAESVKWRVGDLLGGDAGRAMVDEARGWMVSEGARRPERMLEMLTPGRWG